jgi:hypothetical protein
MIDYFNLDHLCPIHVYKQHILLLVVHPMTLYVFIQLLKFKNPRCFFDRTEKHWFLLILAKPYNTLAFLALKNWSLHISYTGVLGEDEGVEICESQVGWHLDLPRVGIHIVIETFIVALPELDHFSPVFTRGTFYFQGSAIK